MAKSEDIVRVMCPNLTCRKVLAIPGKARGKTVRCGNCSMNIRIPAEKPATKETGTGWNSGDAKAA